MYNEEENKPDPKSGFKFKLFGHNPKVCYLKNSFLKRYKMRERAPNFRHIAGSESEYGAAPPLLEEDYFREILRKKIPFIPALGHSPNNFFNLSNRGLLWLENMGNFFLDTGFHPEYATPEGGSSMDVLTWEKAGDYIIMQAAADFNQELWRILTNSCKEKDARNAHDPIGSLRAYVKEKKMKPGQPILRIYKNCVDTARAAYGAHENHLVLRSIRKNKLYQALFLHLASRVVWQGAGSVRQDSKGKLIFHLSQREPFTGQTIGGTAQESKKGMISDREEPIGWSPLGWRLHIVCGDANMSEFAIRLKYITTAMIIFMAEDEFPWQNRLPKLSEQGIIKMFKTFSRDETLKATFPRGSRKLKAVDLQQILLDCAQEYFSKHHLEINADIRWGLENWQYILDLLRSSDPWRTTAGITDCAMKKRLIENDMTRLDYNWLSKPDQMLEVPRKDGSVEPMSVLGRLKYLDLEYHRLSLDGIFFRLNMPQITSQEKIRYALKNPPSQTRAIARKKAVFRLIKNPNHLKIESISWESIKIEIKHPGSVAKVKDMWLDNPFRTEPLYPPEIYKYIYN